MKNVEDFYPLSPMQAGMLFHRLYAPESDIYFEQASLTLRGELNVPAMERAWQEVLRRCSVLRTCFLWEGIREPIQVVQREVELPLEQQDWRGMDEGEQQERLERFLRTDRERGFELSKAPLMRLALIRRGEESYQFIWSHHHLLLDGWSVPLLLQDVFAYYDAFHQGRELERPRPRPYRDYIVWLQKQDFGRAEEYWRRTLKGFSRPTPLMIEKADENRPDQKLSHESEAIRLDSASSARLKEVAHKYGLTLSTVVQGAWALLLSRYSLENDVMFGATVSGRPAELIGVEEMIGLFINTLAVRVKVGDQEKATTWLRRLQQQQAEARRYEYSPLVEVQGWSEVPRGLSMFDSILVFENYPGEAKTKGRVSNFEISDFSGFETTHYPITVKAKSRQEISLSITHDPHRFDTAAIKRMLGHMQMLLEEFANNPEQRLFELQLLTERERHQLSVEWNDTDVAYSHEAALE